MHSTHGRKGHISRLLLIMMACCFLGLALAFVPTPSTPSAHAATRNAKLGCRAAILSETSVFDTYSHWEGTVQLYYECNKYVFGVFVGNNNTWQKIIVYVEYAYMYGFLESSYTWVANGYFESPAYTDPNGCYYAELDLVDNHGIHNWVTTNNVQPSTGRVC